MNKVRGKLLDFKRRLSDRKMYSVVLVTMAILIGFGIYLYRENMKLRQQLDNQYNRAFFDLVGYTNNMETILTKSLLTSSPHKTAGMLQEAWNQANLAQTNLGQLPVSQDALSKTSKFLTQVGDVAFSLNNQTLDGKKMSDPQIKMVEDLHGFAVTLNDSLEDLQNQLNSGRLAWKELSKEGTQTFQKASETKGSFDSINSNFDEYPMLIYDGPFADNLEAIEPKGVNPEIVSEEQAKQSVKKFFGDENIKEIKSSGKTEVEPFKTYSFQVLLNGAADDNYASISVTEKGGHVLWMIYNRPMEDVKLDGAAAKQVAQDFLKAHGYDNMIDTYSIIQDNEITINYEYVESGVVCYPDLIKVKVALDNGQITGFESKGYLTSHVSRKIPTPKISEAEAREEISEKVSIEKIRLAIIPTKWKTEKFVYELKGTLNDQNFLIYINAENGKEEDVLLLIDTPNGTLTL